MVGMVGGGGGRESGESGWGVKKGREREGVGGL